MWMLLRDLRALSGQAPMGFPHNNQQYLIKIMRTYQQFLCGQVLIRPEISTDQLEKDKGKSLTFHKRLVYNLT